MTIGCDNYLGPDMSQLPLGQLTIMTDSSSEAQRDINL